jgi:hypothetical protein
LEGNIIVLEIFQKIYKQKYKKKNLKPGKGNGKIQRFCKGKN